jgi:hypothetical protein
MVGILVSGCGSTEEEADAEPFTPDEGLEQDSLVMPAYPAPQAGRLVALSDGIYDLDGAWEAEAQVCDEPPMLQVLAWQRGMGTLIVLDYWLMGDPVGEYSVVVGNARLTERPPPFARVGVQQFEGSRAWAFQGWDGTVDVTQHDGRTVSGHFSVSLRELQSGDPEVFVGVFELIPIAAASDSGCAILGPRGVVVDRSPADSTSSDPIPR